MKEESEKDYDAVKKLSLIRALVNKAKKKKKKGRKK